MLNFIAGMALGMLIGLYLYHWLIQAGLNKLAEENPDIKAALDRIIREGKK